MMKENLTRLLESYLKTNTATDLDFNNQDIFETEWLETLFYDTALENFKNLDEDELEGWMDDYEVESVEEVAETFCGWESALYWLRKWIGYEQLVYEAEMEGKLEMEKMLQALDDETIIDLIYHPDRF